MDGGVGGGMKYAVYWYIPLTPDFMRLKINLNNPITAATGDTSKYSIESTDQIGWAPALVQVLDDSLKHWLATGVASAYCSLRGKTEPVRQLPRNEGN